MSIRIADTDELSTLKARQKSTWESGDFGRVAKYNEPAAELFMAELPLRPGLQVLDVACGNGNLAIIAAREGCTASGLDIASNLIAQARARATAQRLRVGFEEGDCEAMPYADHSFDVVVSMFGVMFAPRPDRALAELVRVTRPGGLIAMANWTREGFIGEMFKVFGRHLSPPLPGTVSPLLWGDEETVRARFAGTGADLRLVRRVAPLCYPYDVSGTVAFFRKYYGPTLRAFESLGEREKFALQHDLEEIQSRYNVSTDANVTETPAEYLSVTARMPR